MNLPPRLPTSSHYLLCIYLLSFLSLITNISSSLYNLFVYLLALTTSYVSISSPSYLLSISLPLSLIIYLSQYSFSFCTSIMSLNTVTKYLELNYLHLHSLKHPLYRNNGAKSFPVPQACLENKRRLMH